MNDFMRCHMKQQGLRVEGVSMGRYSACAAAKSAAGIGVPEMMMVPTRTLACFFVGATCTRPAVAVWLLVYLADGSTSSMVAQVGAPSGAPVSIVTGYANPAWATTLSRLASLGGSELPTMEAATMATVPTTLAPDVRCVDGHAVTSSLAVAEFFGKRHDDVLRKISNLDCSPEFRARNFAESVYQKPNPSGGSPITYPCYHITRDGFTFLAMGFTGKRAAAWKEAYLNAFNAMEAQLLTLQIALLPSNPQALAMSVDGLVQTVQVLRTAWDAKLYPMLKAGDSPLAAQLYDRFVDLGIFTYQVDRGIRK